MTRTVREEINRYLHKINYDIGFYWWKRYLYCGFWSNVSTPINLAITVLTALTTGQSATQSIVTAKTSTILGSIVLFVSIFNTFFKPNDQLASNVAVLKKWQEHGAEFEEIVYLPDASDEQKKVKLQKLADLFKKINTLKRDTQMTQCIDVIVYGIQQCCLRNHLQWISVDDALCHDNAQEMTIVHMTQNQSESTEV